MVQIKATFGDELEGKYRLSDCISDGSTCVIHDCEVLDNDRKVIDEDCIAKVYVYDNDHPENCEYAWRELRAYEKLGLITKVETEETVSSWADAMEVSNSMNYKCNPDAKMAEYVPPVIGVGVHREMVYIISRNCGRELDVEKGTDKQRLHIAKKIVSALSKIHECGIIHADIKPENVLIDSDQHVRIIDFDTAIFDDGENGDNKFETGTYPFTAPEQTFQHNGKVCKKSDIFSLGMMFMYMFCRKPHKFDDEFWVCNDTQDAETVHYALMNSKKLDQFANSYVPNRFIKLVRMCNKVKIHKRAELNDVLNTIMKLLAPKVIKKEKNDEEE